MAHSLEMIMRILLADSDTFTQQHLAKELASEGIQLDIARNKAEIWDQLQMHLRGYELMLLGRLDELEQEMELVENISSHFPTINIIKMENTENSWKGDWHSYPRVYCTVDRHGDTKILALILKTAVRYGSEVARNQALQTLFSAPERVSGAKTEEALYQQLYYEASQLLPGLDGFMIAHYDEQTSEVSFPFCYKNGKRIHIQSRTGGRGIAEYVLLTKQPLLLPYGDEMFRMQYGLTSPNEYLGHSRSEIVVPMFLDDGKTYGVVFASTDNPRIHYTVEHLQVLTTFTSQAVHNIRNFIQIKEANQLRDATADLASQHGREGVLRAIVKGAHTIVNSDFTGLILVDEHGQLQKAQPVIPENFFYKFGEPRQEGGLTRTVIDSRRPMIIPDTAANQLVKESVREEGIKSMLILPLIHRDRVLGVLYTHTLKPRDFIARDVALWTAFATQAAGALDRVMNEERQIRDYQRLVGELGRLDEPLSLKETLVRVATVAKSVFDSDTCRLFYIDPPTGKVMGTAWAKGDRAEYHIEEMPRPKGSTFYVLQTKRPYFYPDMTDGPAPRSELMAVNLKASASLPLRYGGRDIGVLHCNYFTKPMTFDEHYKTLLEAFGTRAGVALNRAGRVHKADIWHGLDRKIIDCREVRDLYQLFTRKAHEALGADFSIFYPYDPSADGSGRLPLEKECVRVGNFRAKWLQPKGGRGGGVFDEIVNRRLPLIVNELDQQTGKYSSRFSRREGVQAFIAQRLEVILPKNGETRLAGILFLNYRQPAALKDSDLADLRSAGELIAAGILRLSLQADVHRAYQERNEQLRAVIEIFHTEEVRNHDLNLDHIAEHAARSLHLDVCTILEFDSLSQKFTGRGSYGLQHPEYMKVTLRSRYKEEFWNATGPVVISNVRTDRLMRLSKFVRREGIRSTIVSPLRVEGEWLGLLFGNYREHTEPSPEALEAFGLFADVAAHVLHRANLKTKYGESQLKEERRKLLVWVSMVEDMWQHTLVQKASIIRNHAYTLLKRLERHPQLPDAMASVPDLLTEMDRLAADIANAPPRVPRESEMKKELIPIGPLLQELAERELQSIRLQGSLAVQIDVDVRALGGVQVNGYRRWLIYTFESILQNAYAAMSQGGTVTITGIKQKHWAEIRICDTGKGVPTELQDKLFQVAITSKDDRKGLGIGSVLVKTLVEENGGNVELEKPGPGDTTVMIRLPIGKQAKKQ